MQDLTFEVFSSDEGDFAVDSAAVFAGAVIANNLSHSHVIYTFVHEVNHEMHGERCFYKLRLVQVSTFPSLSLSNRRSVVQSVTGCCFSTRTLYRLSPVPGVMSHGDVPCCDSSVSWTEIPSRE